MQLLPSCPTYKTQFSKFLRRCASGVLTQDVSKDVMTRGIEMTFFPKCQITALALSHNPAVDLVQYYRSLFPCQWSTLPDLHIHLHPHPTHEEEESHLLICQNSAKRICRICSNTVCKVEQHKGRICREEEFFRKCWKPINAPAADSFIKYDVLVFRFAKLRLHRLSFLSVAELRPGLWKVLLCCRAYRVGQLVDDDDDEPPLACIGIQLL